MLKEADASGTLSFPFKETHSRCIVFIYWLTFIFSLKRVHIYGIFICGAFFSIPLSFTFEAHPSHWASGAYTTQLLPDYPTTFRSCQLYLQAFSFSCPPSSPTGHPEDSFCHILQNECIISLACQVFSGPPPAIPTPTLQGTFPCSRLRSCFRARLIAMLRCRR